MNGWLTDIRKTALIAAVAMIAASVSPIRTSLQTTFHAVPTLLANPSWAYRAYILIGIAAVAVVVPIAVAVLGFFIALYRSKAELRIPHRLRLLALFAAAASGLELFWSLYKETRYLQSLPEFTTPSMDYVIATLSGVAYIAFLAAIYRNINDSHFPEIREDRLLGLLAKFSLVLWSVAIIGIVVGAVYTVYWTTQNPSAAVIARLYGRERYFPSLTQDLKERAYHVVSFGLSSIPPYIILRSLPKKNEQHNVPAAAKSLAEPSTEGASALDSIASDKPENHVGPA